MAGKTQPISWHGCRGRDGWSSKLDIAEDQASEALNVHFYEGGLCTKRSGTTSAGTLTGMSGINAIFGGYVPGQVETARELFLVDNSATNTIRRMAASSTVSSALTLPSNVAADLQFSWAQINGKLYIAYDHSLNRLAVFDPGYSTSEIRFSGFEKPAAPSTATLGGAGLTFTRYYKVAWTEQRSSVTVRRSELSTATSISITDDSGVQITKPAATASPAEGETHWELYAADASAGPYYLIATTAVGTATVNDTASSIDTTTAEPESGANTPWPSVKFLYSDGSRLYGFGVYETAAGDSHTPRDGTLYFSPVLDASSIHDDERVSNTLSQQGRIAVSRNAGGIDRGLNGLGNTVYAFQSQGIYSFQPTGDDDVPLRRVVVSKELGALTNESIVPAIDEQGRPALYFLDPDLGPYRITRDGLQWVGKDVSDLWANINRAATNKVAHGVYYPKKYQIWWWISTGANDPDTMIVYDCTLGQFINAREGVRGGWSRWIGDIANARCSTMMSNTLGATMSRDLKPYMGQSTGTVLHKCDTGTDDNGTDFQAYLESRAFSSDPMYANKALIKSYIEAETASGVTIRQTLIRNMGDDTNRTADQLLTAVSDGALETEVLKKYDDAALEGAYAFQVRLGDSTSADNAWTLNRWSAAIEMREDR